MITDNALRWVEVRQGFSYIVVFENNEMKVFEAVECAGCQGRGHVNKETFLDTRAPAAFGACPTCDGDQVVRGRQCSSEEIQEVFGDRLAHDLLTKGVFDAE